MRVFASRGMPTTFAALAAAAAERDAAMDLVKRFAARATREGTSAMRAKKSAGGPASFRAFADDRGHAWSRALWRDLASLAGPDGVFGEHFSREDAAAELLCALLRIGGGAERSPLARRILSKVFSDGDGDDDGDEPNVQPIWITDATVPQRIAAMAVTEYTVTMTLPVPKRMTAAARPSVIAAAEYAPLCMLSIVSIHHHPCEVWNPP